MRRKLNGGARAIQVRGVGSTPSLRSNLNESMENKYLDMDVEDAIIEKPYPFTIGTEDNRERHFFLYPVTLGKLYILKRHMENLHINFENMKMNVNLEALRVVTQNKEEVSKVIAYHTLKHKRDIFDTQLVQETVDFIRDNSSNEELATLLIFILTKDNVEEYSRRLGITQENERLRRVVEAKKKVQKSKSDFQFGGKSIYGTLIDQACERYGWKYDYVMWGISFVNLQLLLADKVREVYLSDDEKKKVQSSLLNEDRDVINADKKENMERILSMDWR